MPGLMDLILFAGAIYVIGKWLARRSAESRAESLHNAHFTGASAKYDQVRDPDNIDRTMGSLGLARDAIANRWTVFPPKHDTDLLVDEYAVAHHIFPEYGRDEAYRRRQHYFNKDFISTQYSDLPIGKRQRSYRAYL